MRGGCCDHHSRCRTNIVVVRSSKTNKEKAKYIKPFAAKHSTNELINHQSTGRTPRTDTSASHRDSSAQAHQLGACFVVDRLKNCCFSCRLCNNCLQVATVLLANPAAVRQ